jgi:hypothetical protein
MRDGRSPRSCIREEQQSRRDYRLPMHLGGTARRPPRRPLAIAFACLRQRRWLRRNAARLDGPALSLVLEAAARLPLVWPLAALPLIVHSGSGPGVDLADVEPCFRREQH